MHERHQQYLEALSRRAGDAVSRHELKGVEAEVVIVLDTSKSMYSMYKSNAVSELATRLLALSLEFDDDGVIPAYAFGEKCRHLGDLTKNDFAGWVEREVIRTGSDFQNACNYAPVINDVCSYFFPEDWHRPTSIEKVGRIFKKKQTKYPTLSAPRAFPVYALFVTSGDCMDQQATTDAVRRSSRLPIFWQFVGLQSGKGAPTRFNYLKKLDTLGNTYVDNCGFFEVTDTRNDAQLFEGMCREFPSYLQLPRVAEMITPAELGGLTTKGERGGPVDLQSADTATRMAAFEPDGDAPADISKRAQQRKAAEARAAAKRTERSRVTVQPVDDAQVEPTTALAPHVSRSVKAAKDTRAVAAVDSSRQVKSAPAASAKAAPAPETVARRERRIRLETQQQPLPTDLNEAAAALAKQAARTVMRPALDEEHEAEEREVKQAASTVMRSQIEELDDIDEVPVRRASRPALPPAPRPPVAKPALPSRPAMPAGPPRPAASAPQAPMQRTVIRPAADEMPEFQQAQEAQTHMFAAAEEEGGEDSIAAEQALLDAARARRAQREASAPPSAKSGRPQPPSRR